MYWPPRGQCIDYGCWFSSLVIHSQLWGVMPTGEWQARATVKQSGLLFFRSRFTSFFSLPLYFFPYSLFSSYLLPLLLCLISFFLFLYAQVVRKTLVHEFHISNSHTEWYLLFQLCESNENLETVRFCSNSTKLYTSVFS